MAKGLCSKHPLCSAVAADLQKMKLAIIEALRGPHSNLLETS